MGQSTQNKKSLYEMLLSSINGLDVIDKSIVFDKATLSSFVDFLFQNETEIGKFEEASNEVCSDLEKFDFSSGFNFGRIQHMIEALHPLRLKLVKMGEEAKKLSAFPDRYNSKRAIETCKSLVVACSKKMRFSEIDKVSQLVDANTQKLVELQRDNEILSRINAMINADAVILKSLKAYYAELMQYVSEFPHNGRNDVEEVANRIRAAKKILDCKLDVQSAAASIQDYYDRYNKGAVLARYADTIHQMSTSMRYSDVGVIETQLNDVRNQIRRVIDAFAREHQEVEMLRSSLRTHTAGLWKEDNEQLLHSVQEFHKNDICKRPFNIEKIRDDINAAKQRRYAKIASARNKYPWLSKDEAWRSEHDKLLHRNISEKDYIKAINDWNVQKHTWLILCFVIPYVIWRLFVYKKFE